MLTCICGSFSIDDDLTEAEEGAGGVADRQISDRAGRVTRDCLYRVVTSDLGTFLMCGGVVGVSSLNYSTWDKPCKGNKTRKQ